MSERRKNTEDLQVSARMHELFMATLSRFKSLTDETISLHCKHLGSSTMRAQPLLDLSFLSRHLRAYRVIFSPYTKIDPSLKTEDLPDQVLIGWFAHELGHIVDYHNRSAISMIGFGLTYLLSTRMRGAHERAADLYALNEGFKEEIITTKEYILDNSPMEGKYRRQIMRHYLSPQEIEALALEEINQ